MSRVAEAELELMLRRVDRVTRRREPEWEGFTPDPRVRSICRRMGALATRSRAQIARLRRSGHPTNREYAISNVRRRGQAIVARTIGQVQAILPSLSNNDIDALVGCLGGVESALGVRLPSRGRLRAQVGPRLGVP
jgi:hypothetical protein